MELKKLNLLGKFHHPAYHHKLTFGQKAADVLTKFGGSWTFIILLSLFLLLWILVNGYFLIRWNLGKPFDPYPFILLNLFLSCLAAIQAPIILMSQNREAQRDRLRAEYDFRVNKKAEKEIEMIIKDIQKIKKALKINSTQKIK